MASAPGGRGEAEPWPLPIRIDLSDTSPDCKAETASEALRARPGVAVFVADGAKGEQAIAVSACGDLRAFVGGRLRGEGPRADLSDVTTSIEACECGSGFEADLACDEVARVRTPEAAALAAGQRAACFVHLDPESEAPACRVIEECRTLEGLDPATLIGPFAARSHAEHWAAMIDGEFELCRKPSLLMMQPRAEACQYKDMGLCPAPCDGSEPMEIYRARVRSALAFDGAAFEAERGRLRSAIAESATSMDFEQAGILKKRLGALDAARSAGIGWVTTMDRFRVLAVMPSVKRGWVRIFLHDSGATRLLADVRADAALADKAAVDVVESGLRRMAREPAGFGPGEADRVALVARHARSSRRTRGSLIAIWRDHGAGCSDSLDWGVDLSDHQRSDLMRAIRRLGGRSGDRPIGRQDGRKGEDEPNPPGANAVPGSPTPPRSGDDGTTA